MKREITIEIDTNELARYTDERLAVAWHVAQANPAEHGDVHAGQLVERIGSEIIRRWLRGVPPALYHHAATSYYWQNLTRFAKYTPGGPAGTPEWDLGTWTLKPDAPGLTQANPEPSTVDDAEETR